MGLYYLLDPLQMMEAQDPKIWLGRIVKNRDCPVQGYTPRGCGASSVLEIEDSTFISYARLKEINATKAFKLSVMGELLRTSLDNTKSDEHSFQTQQLQRLRIHHDEETFSKVRDQPDVMSDIEKWGIRHPLYFIVGLLIGTDITYCGSIKKEKSIAGSIDPVQIACIASGVPLPIDSSIGGEYAQGQRSVVSTAAKGSRIFAIEYRVLKLRGIFRDPNKLKLSTSKHKEYSTFASEDDQDRTIGAPQIQVELSSETLEELVEEQMGEEEDELDDEDDELSGDITRNEKHENDLDRIFIVDV